MRYECERDRRYDLMLQEMEREGKPLPNTELLEGYKVEDHK